MGKDVEGSDCGLIAVLSQHLHREDEENSEEHLQNS